MFYLFFFHNDFYLIEVQFTYCYCFVFS